MKLEAKEGRKVETERGRGKVYSRKGREDREAQGKGKYRGGKRKEEETREKGKERERI